MHHYELQQALWHARKMKPCNGSFRKNQLTSVYNYLPDYTCLLECDTVLLGEWFPIFLETAGNHSSNKTASYPQRSQSSVTPLWQPQILQLITCFVATSCTAKKPVLWDPRSGPYKLHALVYTSAFCTDRKVPSHIREMCHKQCSVLIFHIRLQQDEFNLASNNPALLRVWHFKKVVQSPEVLLYVISGASN